MYPYVMAQPNRIHGVNRSQLPCPRTIRRPEPMRKTDSINTTSAEHAHERDEPPVVIATHAVAGRRAGDGQSA